MIIKRESRYKLHKHFPYLLIETTLGRHLVLEVKSEAEELTYKAEKKRLEDGELSKDKITSNPLMKEVGFSEFKELNSNFDYHIIFNGTVLSHQQKVLEKITGDKNG